MLSFLQNRTHTIHIFCSLLFSICVFLQMSINRTFSFKKEICIILQSMNMPVIQPFLFFFYIQIIPLPLTLTNSASVNILFLKKKFFVCEKKIYFVCVPNELVLLFLGYSIYIYIYIFSSFKIFSDYFSEWCFVKGSYM